MRTLFTSGFVQKLTRTSLAVFLIGLLVLNTALDTTGVHTAHAAGPIAIAVDASAPDGFVADSVLQSQNKPTTGCNLRKAVQDISDNANGVTLSFPECTTTGAPGNTNVITFAGTGPVNLTDGDEIAISDIPLAINGPVALDGSGNNNARAFNITEGSGQTVSMLNVSFSNFGTTGNGGGSGGAIELTSGTLNIVDGSFTNNQASSDGGAIDASSGTVILTNVLFTKNQAKHNGGALNFVGSGGDIALLTNVVFTYNSADENGGAISNEEAGQNSFGNFSQINGMLITNALFTLNTANASKSDNMGNYEGGGAIYNNTGYLGLVSVSFGLPYVGLGNSANGTDGRGGAILNTIGVQQLYTNQVYYNGNSATTYGGAVYNRGPMYLVANYFDGNNAANGGALASDSTNSTSATINNSTFHGNTASSNGGGIYTFYESGGSQLDVINSTIANNTAQNGGGVYNDSVQQGSGNVSLGNTIIASNNGKNCGWNTGANPAQPIADNGHNLEFPGASAASNTCFNNASNNDVFGDPMLGSPFLNPPDAPVFPTPPVPPLVLTAWTMALNQGSAAIEAGDNSICSKTFLTSEITNPSGGDARDSKRPNPAGTTCDIGAFESKIDPSQQLDLTESFSPATIYAGQNSNLNFNLSNTSSSSFTGVNFVATLDPQITVPNIGAAVNGCGNGNGTISYSNNQITVSGLTLAAGQQCTISVGVTDSTVGTNYSKIPQIQGTQSSNTVTNSLAGGLTAALTVQTKPAVLPANLTANFTPSTVLAGANSTLTYTISNPNGGSQALNNVGFNAFISSKLAIPATASVSNCGNTATATISNHQLSVSGIKLNAGANNCTVTLTNVSSTVLGAWGTYVPAITATESNNSSLNASAVLNVVAMPPTLAKAFNPTTITAGGTSTLTLTLHNPNNSDLSNVSFTDTFPGNLKIAPSNSTVNNCGSGTVTAVANAGSVSVSGVALPAASPTCTIVVTVTDATAEQVNNTVTQINSTESGSGSINATATLTVNQPVAPTLTKAFNPTTINQGGTSTLTFTLGNTNPSTDLTNVSFTDDMSAIGVTVAATPNVANSCNNGTVTATAGANTIAVSGVKVPAGVTCTISVDVTSNVVGPHNNTVSQISATETGTSNVNATATLTVNKSVTPSAPTLTKAFNPTTITAGGTSTLTFTLTNPNATDLSNVSFTDNFPGNLKIAPSNTTVNNCGSGTVTISNFTSVSVAGVSIPAAKPTCTIVVTVTDATQEVDNNVVSSISSTESGSANINATATLTVNPAQQKPSLPTLAKAFNPAIISQGDNSTLTFTVGNPNATALSNVSFTDDMTLTNVQVVAANPNVTISNCGATPNVDVSNVQKIVVSGVSLAGNATCTISVNVTTITAGNYNNVVNQISSTESGSGSINATATLKSQIPSAPTLTKAFNPTTIAQNGTSTLTFTIGNPNTSSISGVTFTDFIGNFGISVANTANVVNNCGGVIDTSNPSQIAASSITLQPNATCTFSVDVTSSAVGPHTNTVTSISSTESGSGNPNTSATLTVQNSQTTLPPTLTKAFGQSTIQQNGKTTLTFTLTNPNKSDLSNVTFTDTFPGSLKIDPSNVTNNGCGGTVTAVANSGSVSVSGVSLPAASPTCTIVVTVTDGAVEQITNTVTQISSTESGSASINATATLTVQAAAVPTPPTLTKAFNPSTITTGGTSTLTFTLGNTNPSTDLTNVSFTDDMSAIGLTVAATPNVVNTCNNGTVIATAGANTIAVSGVKVAIGITCTISVNVTSNVVGPHNNVVSQISATETGTSNVNATATLTVNPVQQPATVPTLTKKFGSNPINVGGVSTLTFTVTNPNNSDLSNITFTDSLPNGMTVASNPNIGGTCVGTITAPASANSIQVSGVNLKANLSCTITIDVTTSGAGTFNNSVTTISSTESGQGAATAKDTLTVNKPVAGTPVFNSKPIAPGPINIGTTTVGTTISANISVYNTGTASLHVGSNGISGANSGDFGVTTSFPFDIAVNGPTQNVTVTCTPSVVGLRTATLTLTSNDPNNQTVAFTLNCTGQSATGGQPTYTYYLPYLANNASGFTTSLMFQNSGAATANVTLKYYDVNGNAMALPANTCTTVAQYGRCTPPNPFTSGNYGSGVLISDQPLSVLVSESTPYGGSSYAIPAGASANLTAPLAINNYYGGFVTRLVVLNVADTATTVTVNFYSDAGVLQSNATRTLNVPAHTSQMLDQSNESSQLPSGFNGWAQIAGANGSQLVAQVLEQNPNNRFVALANAEATTHTTTYAAAIFRNAFGGFYTGENIVNPNNNSVTVTVTYYNNDGTVINTTPFTLGAHSIGAIYSDNKAGIGIPSGGLPNNFYGAMMVTTQGGGIVEMVNEAAGTLASGGARSGTYAAVQSGNSSLGLPVVANDDSNGFTSGITVLNTSNQTVSGQIQFYNADGTPAGNAQAFTVGNTGQQGLIAHASQPYYQANPKFNLPSGFNGTAVVTQTSGSPNSLLATVNMQSSNVFFTFSEPTN